MIKKICYFILNVIGITIGFLGGMYLVNHVVPGVEMHIHVEQKLD